MSVTDLKMARGSSTVLKAIRLSLGTTATSQTAKQADAILIPFAFQVERVEVCCQAVTAAITVDVKIGSTSVLTGAITPVANTPTVGTVTSTLANKRGAKGAQLNVLYTSDGAGASTKCDIVIWLRPRPLNGEG